MGLYFILQIYVGNLSSLKLKNSFNVLYLYYQTFPIELSNSSANPYILTSI